MILIDLQTKERGEQKKVRGTLGEGVLVASGCVCSVREGGRCGGRFFLFLFSPFGRE